MYFCGRLTERPRCRKHIFRAFRKHWNQGDQFVTSHQNIAEFWNVATRPASARGGFGLSVDETLKRVETIEKLGKAVPFTNACYVEWRRLLMAHSITGVSVHDARLVATMKDAWDSSLAHAERSRFSSLRRSDRFGHRSQSARFCGIDRAPNNTAIPLIHQTYERRFA